MKYSSYEVAPAITHLRAECAVCVEAEPGDELWGLGTYARSWSSAFDRSRMSESTDTHATGPLPPRQTADRSTVFSAPRMRSARASTSTVATFPVPTRTT